MKLYIFLTTLIRGIGGGHIYTLNKIHYLKKNGYDTAFIHANMLSGSIEIKELLAYENMYEEDMLYPTYYYKRNEQKKAIERISRMLPNKDYDEIIIESQTINCATWGELLAKHIGAKHLVYLLGEHIKISNRQMLDFFCFKLSRRELVGIGVNSIPTLFKTWKEIEPDSALWLNAYCTNVLNDVDYPFEKIPKADYIIGSIGRLDKPFLLKTLPSVVHFINQHSDKSFTILLIGGSKNEKLLRNIRTLVSEVANASLYITGNLYPIPYQMVKMADVFLSTSGSCIVSAQIGKPTIAYDVHDYLPIGLLGRTTNNSLFRAIDEPPLDIEDLLKQVLIDKKYQDICTDFDVDESNNIDFSEHMTFLETTSNDKNYYDITSAHLSIKECVELALVFVTGKHNTFKIFNCLSPIWKLYKKMKYVIINNYLEKYN